MLKKLHDIDVLPILTEYIHLEKKIEWTVMGSKGKQAGIQHLAGENIWSSAVGKGRGIDLTCNELNPHIKNTIFEKLIVDYKLTRTRLMWVNEMSCYSIHKDKTPRIHIPLITNPECYFVFKDNIQATMEHIPTGAVYWTDTRKYHTFMNCSTKARLHLIGVVEE